MTFFQLFESNVNSDSIQTLLSSPKVRKWFESNVNSDSIQTFVSSLIIIPTFESDVNSDSIQTNEEKQYNPD